MAATFQFRTVAINSTLLTFQKKKFPPGNAIQWPRKYLNEVQHLSFNIIFCAFVISQIQYASVENAFLTLEEK